MGSFWSRAGLGAGSVPGTSGAGVLPVRHNIRGLFAVLTRAISRTRGVFRWVAILGPRVHANGQSIDDLFGPTTTNAKDPSCFKPNALGLIGAEGINQCQLGLRITSCNPPVAQAANRLAPLLHFHLIFGDAGTGSRRGIGGCLEVGFLKPAGSRV